jgi:hypothetical protein
VADDDRTEAERREADAAHRAIGRYFVAFSRLIAHMRGLMSQRLVIDSYDRVELAELAFATAMAQQVADSFFAMCRYDGELSEAEKGVCELLCRSVNEEIEWRNRFAHGDWWISGPYGDPELIRMTPKKSKGMPAEMTTHPPKEMDERSDTLWALIEDIMDFGRLALGLRVMVRGESGLVLAPRSKYRVEDVFTYTPPRKSGKNPQKATFTRDGPKATTVLGWKAEVF